MEYRNFDTLGNIIPTVQPLTVTGANGTSQWTGLATIRVFLSWSAETFPDPALTADKPGTPNSSAIAWAGSATSGSGVPVKLFSTSFAISPIAPVAGDYNRDGTVTASDHTEWRKAFGESQPQYMYADGNNNGLVDGSDYIIWRKANSSGGTGTISGMMVPEPASYVVAVVGCAVVAICRRRARQRADFIGEN
jgi:hypothetical protein